MKQALKEWLIPIVMGLIVIGSIAWPVWRAYRQYQVEQAIINLSNKK